MADFEAASFGSLDRRSTSGVVYLGPSPTDIPVCRSTAPALIWELLRSG